jgi:hypothetical protein
MPKSWGSHASRLTSYLLQGHADAEIDRQVRLDRQSIDRVITWIDINAPYYPDYAGGAFRDNPFGRSPISQAEFNRLGELIGVNFLDRKVDRKKVVGLVNFTRPENSLGLASLADPNDPRRLEALAIVRSGQGRLATLRRPDMPGFQLVAPAEIERDKRYQFRLSQEARMRAAIANGQKQFPEEK